jgi:hypothetical protein
MRNGVLLLLAFVGLGGIPVSAGAAKRVSLPLGPDLSRADLYVQPCEGEARGTLILAPGVNGNGQGLIEEPGWLDYAKKEHLNLVGLSFASEKPGLTEEQGYYFAAKGSGQELMDGLAKALGDKTGPILIYGFSRGGQFSYSLARWQPQRILAWCAYTATDWEPVEETKADGPGLIACGEDDGANYGTSLAQFNKGRSQGRHWTWVSLAHTGHAWSTPLDGLVRAYFSALLADSSGKGMWLDVDSKTPVEAKDVQEHPTLAAWLPDETVAAAWKNLHQP